MGENASQIREAINSTRDQIGETLEALSYKTDIPARASEMLVAGVGTAKDSMEKALEQVAHSIDDTTKSVRSTVKETTETVQHSIKDLSDRTEPFLHSGQERIAKMSSAADDALRRGFSSAVQFTKENPVTAIFGIFALGLVVGRMLPRKQS